MIYRISRIAATAVLTVCISLCQEVTQDQSQEQESKRILGIVPNYRTSPSLEEYKPLTAG